MNTEFYEALSNEDALLDLFVDQLHRFAELELEEPKTTTGSVAQMDRATAFLAVGHRFESCLTRCPSGHNGPLEESI